MNILELKRNKKMFDEILDMFFKVIMIPASLFLNVIPAIYTQINFWLGIAVAILTIIWLLCKLEDYFYERRNRQKTDKDLDI